MATYTTLMRSIDQATNLVQSTAIPDPEKKQILSVLSEAKRPIDTDVWIWRSIIWALAIIAVVPVVAGVVSVAPPTFKDVLPLAAAAIGGLVGLLAPSPVKDR